jgi:hypothetical protein
MSNNAEQELTGYIYNLLSTDSTLTASTGIDPATFTARAVTVFNEVKQDQPMPYVRLTLSDTVLMDSEPYEDGYVPTAKTISLTVTAFAPEEYECLAISGRLQTLLQHREITTASYHGSSWLTAVDMREDRSNPDNVYRMAVLRVRVNLTPLP